MKDWFRIVKMGTLGLCLVFAAYVIAPEVDAQTNGNASQPQRVTVATVNAQDLVVSGQEQYSLQLEFNISNREGVQPSIIYAVNLYELGDDKEVFSTSLNRVDQHVYGDDVVSLGEHDSLHKRITYDAPQYLSGDYALELEVRNPDGLILSIVRLRDAISLDGAKGDIHFDTNSCYLTVGDETTQYTPQQGVDVAVGEVLTAHCSVESSLAADSVVTPQLVTYYRTTFGTELATEKLASRTIVAGASERLTVAIPLQTDPQAYDVVLSLVDETGAQVSTEVIFHYVIQGASATIQNLTLDKDRYESGEIAYSTVFWTGSVDDFPGARGTATSIGDVVIQSELADGNGVACALPGEVSAGTGGGSNTLAQTITTACVDPSVTVRIIDSEGTILAERIYKVTSKEKKGAVSTFVHTNVPLTMTEWIIAGVGVLVLILILLLIGAHVRRHRQENTGVPPGTMALLFLFLAVGLFGGADQAHADTFALVDGTHTYYFTAGIDKSTYSPLETIVASASFVISTCANGITNFGFDEGWVKADDQTIFEYPINGNSGSVNLTAPEVAGSYYVQFTAFGSARGFDAYGGTRIPYTVTGAGVQCAYNGSLTWGSGCSTSVNTTVNSNALLQVQNTAAGYAGEAAYYCENDSTLTLRDSWCTADIAPQPSAQIDASDCAIAIGGSSCESSVWWTSDSLVDPQVKHDGSLVSTSTVGTNKKIYIGYGNNTFTISDGHLEFGSTVATASCPTGTTWRNGVCEADYNLTASVAPSVNGTLTQGQLVTFNATVQNSGGNAVTTPFKGRFYYTFANGNSPVDHPFPGDAISATLPFNSGATQTDVSGQLRLTRSGNVTIQYCADVDSELPEIDETDNCLSTTFSVAAGPASYYGTITAEDCEISVGYNHCYSPMYWDTANSSTVYLSVIDQYNAVYGGYSVGTTMKQWGGADYKVPYGTSQVELSVGGSVVASDSVTGSCVSGLVWNGSYCNTSEGELGSVNLQSYIRPTVNGTLTEGETITLNAQVKNTGGTDITTEFRDQFLYSWSPFFNTYQLFPTLPNIVSPTFVAGATQDEVSGDFYLSQNGTLYIRHCVDIDDVVAESYDGGYWTWGSTDNCSYASFSVVSATAQAGVCGDADGHSYDSTDTAYAPYSQCALVGSPSSNTTFPDPGTTETWVCGGIDGGANSPTCSASRAPAEPVATITASGCDVAIGSGSCPSSVTWTSSYVSSPSVRLDGSEFSTAANDSVSQTITLGQHDFTFYENGGGQPLDAATVAASCVNGASHNVASDTCVTTPATPVMSVDASPSLVRFGATSTVAIQISSAESITCTINGLGGGAQSFVHDGAVTPTALYSYVTSQLYSTQEVTITCYVTDVPSVTTTSSVRVEVIGAAEEL